MAKTPLRKAHIVETKYAPLFENSSFSLIILANLKFV